MNHKFWNAGSGKPEDITHAVKNVDSVTIPAGIPVVYVMNGTDDGLAVALASTTTAADVTNFLAGVTTKEIPVGKLGEVQVYGFCRAAKVARGTRANTTTPWATMASIAKGAILAIGDNGFISGGAGATGLNQPFAVIAQLVAAGPTLPATAGSGTVYYQSVGVFLRCM